MKVKDLIALLEEFPESLPVYFSLGDGTERVLAPVDAIMNLVNAKLGVEMPENYPGKRVPEGYYDSLVVYPHVVRDDCD
jgi:hypothetical protein